MSALTVDDPAARPHVRPVEDGRPPSHGWSWTLHPDGGATGAPPAAVAESTQPALLFAVDDPVARRGPHSAGHRVHVVNHGWTHRPPVALPDPRSWSASLALALAEVLQGRRPVGQLSRWVDEPLLAVVAERQQRSPRARPADGGPARPAVRSVHLHLVGPAAVEVAAHLQQGTRSHALAFRLAVRADRWLCTALDLGPAPEET